MADEAEDDELVLTDELDGEKPEGDQEEQQDPDKSGDEDEEESVVTFGDEAAPASGERDTGLVKHLREEIRKRDTRLAEMAKAPVQTIEVGERPTLEGCEWDEDKHAEELEAWVQRKAKAEQVETEAQTRQRAANEAFQTDLQRYETAKAGLTFGDKADAAATVAAILDTVQRAVIVKVADNPALVEYSLGKHPTKLAELSKIQDPLKLAAAVVKLEGQLKVTTRRKAPEPEQVERGSGTMPGSDKALERLEAEADRTGDRSKVIAYQRQKRTAKT